MNDQLAHEQDLEARITAFILTFAQALQDFAQIDADDDARSAWIWRETLAEVWTRNVKTALELTQDEFLSPEVFQLLAMLESAQTVRKVPGPDVETEEVTREILDESMRAGESWQRLRRVGEQFYPGWEEGLDQMWHDHQAAGTAPPGERPKGWPPVERPKPRHPRRSTGTLSEVWAEAAGDLLLASAAFHRTVEPQRHEITEAQRVSALDLIRAISVLDRKIDLMTKSFSARHWAQYALTLGELRAQARSLVLAVSEDPERRALAMPYSELHMRVGVLQRRLKGSSAHDAWRAVLEERYPDQLARARRAAGR